MIPVIRLRSQLSGFVLAAAAVLAAFPATVLAQPDFTVVHSFNGADGFGPMAGIIQGPDGALYGTTSQGGSANGGTVFRLDLWTGSTATLHEFSGLDGALPYSGLAVGLDGWLYGSTYAGGAADLGTLFQLDPNGQRFVTLHSFNGTDGARPDDLCLTLSSDGQIYGATSEGGAKGGGTLFRLDPASQTLSTLHEFSATAGVDAGLIAGHDGCWYGTTYSGGSYRQGSVFVVLPGTQTPITLHDFSGTDGAAPVPGSLTMGRDGNLYGTTQLGGNGTVYQLDLTSGTFRTLHVFSGTTDGRMPLGGLVEAGDGYFYGTTVLGGQGYGTVFRVNPATLDYGIVVRFGGSNGRSPSGNLCLASDGALYGVTRVGGAFNAGTVYRLGLPNLLPTPSAPDAAPPTILSITASPSVLKPTNGKMIAVALTVQAKDDRDPAPVSRIVGVTCNQPASGDWEITGDLTLNLRADRMGKATRIYTIDLECTDASGNSSTGTVTVSVSK